MSPDHQRSRSAGGRAQPTVARARKLLKIALVRQRYTPFGGAERFVANAVRALRAEGASLTIVTRRWPGGEEFAPLICNPFYLGSLWRDWSFARCVCSSLKNQNFDLVQSHERISCCDIYRAGDGVHREWLTQRRRVLGPLSRLGVALNPYHHQVLSAEKKLFASTQLKAVICNSSMVKEEIQRYFGLPEEKLHVIYSGVDLDAFHPGLRELHRTAVLAQNNIPADATVFLFVGSGFERKGLATALRALADLPASAHLLVVGKDKKLEQFRRLANKLGVEARVRFLDGQENVKPFYGAADAFVLPTLYDPFPNAALEAFACGLPVITSTKSGAAELIRTGENGFVYDALDVAGLVSAMRQIATQGVASYSARSRDTVAALSPAAMSSRLFALYRDLLNDARISAE
ncbi:glycosyltransferase family 4 protein [Sulfuricella denitrificans]|uniref:glycosyltransferase family 4 protein n=1 Tax=Sulfuricella denitrificans TaxID=649841 RepID=UPI0002884BCB|nr:glycosyltransferase family 4 protein [Sulfuricella denitrificans]